MAESPLNKSSCSLDYYHHHSEHLPRLILAKSTWLFILLRAVPIHSAAGTGLVLFPCLPTIPRPSLRTLPSPVSLNRISFPSDTTSPGPL